MPKASPRRFLLRDLSLPRSTALAADNLFDAPAPASRPLSDGLAIMSIDGRVVKVDTTAYNLTERDEAVALNRDGMLVITAATLASGAPFYGKRYGLTPWQAPGPSDVPGSSGGHDGVWIVGKVVG